MGMFDSFYDAEGKEWQTKAYERLLAVWRVGDDIDASHGLTDYQVEVLGDPGYAWATIRGRRVTEVGVARDASLPCVRYHGQVEDSGPRAPTTREVRYEVEHRWWEHGRWFTGYGSSMDPHEHGPTCEWRERTVLTETGAWSDWGAEP